jgi:hypothetical protein
LFIIRELWRLIYSTLIIKFIILNENSNIDHHLINISLS